MMRRATLRTKIFVAMIAGASWLAAASANAAALDAYVGKDPFEKVGGRTLYQLPKMKKDFVAKFGESRWTTLLSYQTSQPIAAVDDAWLGRVIVTWQCKPHDCTNQAALVLHPAGDVVGVCFAGDHGTEWFGIGWQISAAKSDCSSEAADIVANYKAAAAHAGR